MAVLTYEFKNRTVDDRGHIGPAPLDGFPG